MVKLGGGLKVTRKAKINKNFILTSDAVILAEINYSLFRDPLSIFIVTF